jgi:putative transposase
MRKIFDIAAIKVNGLIENIEIMPDHVHVFIRMKRNHFSLPKIVQMLKGFTSFAIRKRNPWMLKYKAFWSAGYFAESIGNMSESIIKKYIDNQRTNIKSSYRYKRLVLKRSSFPSYMKVYGGDINKMPCHSKKILQEGEESCGSGVGNDAPQQEHIQFEHLLSTEMVRGHTNVF